MEKSEIEWTCIHCSESYNMSEVGRIYGKESAVYLQGYCSAQCYTKKVLNINTSNNKET